MKVSIINTGDEVVNGSVVNTNATFMAKKLFEEGYTITCHLSIKDDDPHFEERLKSAFSQSDIVLLTGGLGPTCDDLTRKTLAHFFGCEFTYNKEIEEDFLKRYKTPQVWFTDQATIPSLAKPLLNTIGSAPGLLFEENGKALIALPGVPNEMRSLMDQQVMPYLRKKFGTQIGFFIKKMHFCLLSESMIDPVLREIKGANPGIEIGIYPSYGTVEVVAKSKQHLEVVNAEKLLAKNFASYQYDCESGKISEALHNLLIEQKLTLAFAESCTGGSLAKEMTSWPSSSSYFLGSLVTYANQLKQDLLNVTTLTLEKEGAVSKACAEEMVRGLLDKTSAQVVAAVSGIAGPTGGSKEKPVGTVWVAIARRYGDIYTFKLNYPGNREVIIQRSTIHILAHLYRLLKKDIIPSV